MNSHFNTRLQLLAACALTISTSACTHLNLADHCQPSQLTFQSQDFQVQTLSYTATSPSQKTILIIPPTGGTNIIDRSYAAQFCKNGYHAYILSSWTGDTEVVIDFEIHQRFYTNAQKAISTVLEQIETPFIGVLGTSVGGLHASIAASTQERVNAVFAITAGTPIAEVVVYSSQKAMIDLNKRRKERFKTTGHQDQVNRINQAFHLEPQKLEPLYLKKDLGLAMALDDTIVPIEQQKKLQQLWNPQTVIEINNDHFFGIIKTWFFYSDKILAFFNKSSQSNNN
jgi:hypothetical protein